MTKDILAIICIVGLIILNTYSLITDKERKQHMMKYILYFAVAALTAATLIWNMK